MGKKERRESPPGKQEQPDSAAGRLRGRAEGRVREAKGGREATDLEARRLLHELEVHQVELELQNAELQAVREELEVSLEQYTELYDFAPVGYFTLDVRGTVSAVNLAGASLLGVVRSRLLGRSLLSFLNPMDRPAFSSFLETVIKGSGKKELEIELTPQSAVQPLFVKVEAIAAPSGRDCRAAVIDITKRRRAEQELEQYRAHLERLVGERTATLEAEILERRRAEERIRELNATLEQRVVDRTAELRSTIRDLQTFSYSVSHDLRAPLRSINSYASMLVEDFSAGLEEEGKRLLSVIVQRTVTMGALIDDLLSFSRNSRLQLAMQTIDMTALAVELADRVLAGSGRDTVEFRIAQLPEARGDRAMVSQALENLMANAVKFSGKAEHPVVEVGTLRQGTENIYFVKDNGIGFEMKYVDAIFGVFQRLENSEEYEGTGVGLAIVKQVVSKHGGRVWAESAPGQGATFYFTLPAP